MYVCYLQVMLINHESGQNSTCHGVAAAQRSSLCILPKHCLDLEEKISAPLILQLCCLGASVSLYDIPIEED